MKAHITKLTVIGVSIIALSAFALSFDALRQMATLHGINPMLAWVFPVAIDLAILVYSMASILRRFQGLSAKVEIGFVVFATLVSVVLNALSGHDDPSTHAIMGVVIHALPPLFLGAAVEAASRLFSADVEARSSRAKRGVSTRRRNRKSVEVAQ